MSNPAAQFLHKLLELSKVDAVRARIYSERKKLENEHQALKQALKAIKTTAGISIEQHEKAKASYQKEEKDIKFERDKLVERRKALASVTNYKTQQAAMREIEGTSRTFDAREELMIQALVQLDKLEAARKDAEGKQAEIVAKLQAFELDLAASIDALEQRDLVQQQQRVQYTDGVERAKLAIYERVREKYPMDPIVLVKKDLTCAACSMQLGPQVLVKIGRAEELVRCSGCQRIMFADFSKPESTESDTGARS